jgi:hypothetical protein
MAGADLAASFKKFPRCRQRLRPHKQKLLLKWRCDLFAQPTKEMREQTQKEIKKPPKQTTKGKSKVPLPLSEMMERETF